MPLRHLHNVFHVKVGRDGSIQRHPAGRFLTAGNHVHILEDYHNLLGGHLTEGSITMESLAQIAKLKNSQYLDVVSQQDLEEGKRPEHLPEAKLDGGAPSRLPSFEYKHQGNATSDHIEFRDGVPHFNGVPTSHTHINALMANVKSGLASVRYRPDAGATVRKMEAVFGGLLMKAGGDSDAASAAFQRLRELVQAGHLDPEHERVLAGLVFRDSMVPEMGNKFAFNDFMSRHQGGGVHVMMDANDFKSVNDIYGHPTGDAAIKSMGKAAREAMDEAVGPGNAKLFRMGGDEFAAHVPDHESAARFARALRAKLDKLEPIAGQHRLSMSFGFGADHDSADKALYEAKKQKYSPETRELPDTERESRVRLHKRGQTPHLAHSLVPGFEGALPLDTSGLNVKPPPPPPLQEVKPEQMQAQMEAPKPAPTPQPKLSVA